MTGSPGPSSDQEALQEEFLGGLEALGGSAGNGRLRELLGWEEGPYEAVKASLLATGRLRPAMRTLYIRHVPDEVAARLEQLAARAGLPLSTFALQELTESARRADNAELLNALPSLPIERASILEALAESRTER
jgi:hypothetical protein